MAKPFLIYKPKQTYLIPTTTNPANGGKLFIYQTGTTTKQNTYPTSADAVAGTNVNTNPIILNSAGEPAVDMYSTLSYKMVFAPSTDTDPPANAYWTEDLINSNAQTSSVMTKTTTYLVTTADRDKLICVDATSGNLVVTLPSSASCGNGFVIGVKKIDSSGNTVTITCNAAETWDGANTEVLSSQYEIAYGQNDGTQWWQMNGA